MPALSSAVEYQRMQIPSRWHIEHQHRERQLPVLIIALAQHEPEARSRFATGALPFEAWVLFHHVGNAFASSSMTRAMQPIVCRMLSKILSTSRGSLGCGCPGGAAFATRTFFR